eukprot:TRINITY_DN28270_c0_g1_i1.p1 TRINITY_DN28270_c0_g1~~TRINITY_DN28270_c0_g1_i1.p1  ORF type:complete len:434 (+),score=88.43 TRINITY_DN28270_c0_g1_i1:64-1365(+)
MCIRDRETLVEEEKTVLGKGGFGQVEERVFKPTGEIFALKTVVEPNPDGFDPALEEIELLMQITLIDNLTVCKMLAFEMQLIAHQEAEGGVGMQIKILMERGECNLEEHCKTRRKLGVKWDEGELLHLYRTILNGIMSLHSYSIFHRDIKPKNIVITSKGIFKLIDFGVSQTYQLSPEGLAEVMAGVGTGPFLAPEIQEGGPEYVMVFPYLCDLYAAGKSLLEAVMISTYEPEVLKRKSFEEKMASLRDMYPDLSQIIQMTLSNSDVRRRALDLQNAQFERTQLKIVKEEVMFKFDMRLYQRFWVFDWFYYGVVITLMAVSKEFTYWLYGTFAVCASALGYDLWRFGMRILPSGSRSLRRDWAFLFLFKAGLCNILFTVDTWWIVVSAIGLEVTNTIHIGFLTYLSRKKEERLKMDKKWNCLLYTSPSPRDQA